MSVDLPKNVRLGVRPKKLDVLTTKERAKSRIFVDSAPEDMSLASYVAQRMRSAGMEVDSYGNERKVGRKQLESAAELVRKSDVAVFLLTPNSVRSDWMLAELGLALGRELPVIAITAGVKGEEVPTPFRGKEVVGFDHLEEVIRKLSHEEA